MDIYEFLTESVQREYTTVKVLKDSQRSRITLLRHNHTGKPFVFRQFTGDSSVYRRLLEINCPHLPQVLEVGEKDGSVAVLEEYIHGETLDKLLEAGLFSEKEVRRTAREILSGLQVLHSLGAVHRDIKPENVILRETGAVLIDFDASRIYKQAQTTDTHVLGTTGYAAPEQFGVAQTDHRADIYAMGVLMNIMLTGKHPSKAMAGGSMGRIISKCTMMDPDKRYKSCAQLLGVLSGKKNALPAMILSGFVLLAILFVWLPGPEANTLTAPESSAEESLPVPQLSPSPTAAPSPSPTPSPVPSPEPTPEPTPEPVMPSAKATYTDEDGTYHLFLCFDAGMIARYQSQESRTTSLPPDTRTGCPSILSVYKAGSPENVTEEFAAKIREFSVEAIPTGDGSPMELFHGEITPEFSGAMHLVSISMCTDNKENEIRWTLNMENGQVISLSHVLAVEQADTLVITPENADMTTLELLQQQIDYLGNEAGPGVPVDIHLPPVTYEGDLFIRYHGVNLIGNPEGTTLNGSITVISPISETVLLQNLTLVGQGGTGVEAHAPVTLYDCTLTGYEVAAAAYDGGFIGGKHTVFTENGVGIYLDSDNSPHVDVGYDGCQFIRNTTAMQILAVDSDMPMIFPGATFSDNGWDILNEIDYPVDMSAAILEPIR